MENQWKITQAVKNSVQPSVFGTCHKENVDRPMDLDDYFRQPQTVFPECVAKGSRFTLWGSGG